MLNAEQTSFAASTRRAILEELGKVFIGPQQTPELLLTALVAGGHVLLEGVPGVAKTTLVKGFAATLNCAFSRIQFTPDLLPADITGTYILDMKSREFELRRGPIFAKIVLGDEINRAPAKTQSALLEAMQEAQVTIEGKTEPLGQPFMVLATQNPIEQEGTYPLPEAQVDRFLLHIRIHYPDAGQEVAMLHTHSQAHQPVHPVLDPDKIRSLQAYAESVHVDDELLRYIVDLSRFTREHNHVDIGASPRASLMLLRVAKAHALLDGRDYVLPDDVKQLAIPALAHRLVLSPDADIDGVTAFDVIRRALESVRYHRKR